MLTNNKRSALIDLIKGVGIFTVVFCHLDTDGQITRNVFISFNMPLFFFISGVVSKFEISEQGFKEDFIKLLKRIYLPYALFTIIDILPRMVVFKDYNLLSIIKQTALN